MCFWKLTTLMSHLKKLIATQHGAGVVEKIPTTKLWVEQFRHLKFLDYPVYTECIFFHMHWPLVVNYPKPPSDRNWLARSSKSQCSWSGLNGGMCHLVDFIANLTARRRHGVLGKSLQLVWLTRWFPFRGLPRCERPHLFPPGECSVSTSAWLPVLLYPTPRSLM